MSVLTRSNKPVSFYWSTIVIELFVPESTADEVREATERVIASGQYARGEEVQLFESELGQLINKDYVIATSCGSTALHASVRVMDWGAGDRILTSPYSFIATSNALIQEDCQPVFGRTGMNLQLDLHHAYELISKDSTIRGIVIPHIFGHEVDVEALGAIRKDYPDIGIIEDAAQALETADSGLGFGVIGDITTYSFHENKVITTAGEGGAIATDDPVLAERLRSLTQHGKIESSRWLDEINAGFNYRLSEIQAAVGRQQLQRIRSILDQRRSLAHALAEGLAESELLLPNDAYRSWFGFYLIAADTEQASYLAASLRESDVQSCVRPMPALQDFAHNRGFQTEDAQISELASRVLMLPLHTRLDQGQIDTITHSIVDAMHNRQSGRVISSSEFYDQMAHSYDQELIERSAYIDAVDDHVVAELSSLEAGSTVIDIGAGNGRRTADINQQIEATVEALDNSRGMLAYAAERGLTTYLVSISEADEVPASMHEAYDAATSLWNVLGHIPNEERMQALQNIRHILKPDGRFILDVNNLFNAEQYGAENAAANRARVKSLEGSRNAGDFTASRVYDGATVKTTTHIFHTAEIRQDLEAAGFVVEKIEYVNYETGEPADESSGQILVIARKPAGKASNES